MSSGPRASYLRAVGFRCNDFIDYLGVWKPQDFRRQASDDDGRKFLLEMTPTSEMTACGMPLHPDVRQQPEELVRHLLRPSGAAVAASSAGLGIAPVPRRFAS